MSPQTPRGIEGADQDGVCLPQHAPHFTGCHPEVSTSVWEVLWEDLGQKNEVSGVKDTVSDSKCLLTVCSSPNTHECNYLNEICANTDFHKNVFFRVNSIKLIQFPVSFP